VAKTFASRAFVVEAGVVYLGPKHPDAAMAKYQIGRVERQKALLPRIGGEQPGAENSFF
jgi:hypothetical protein